MCCDCRSSDPRWASINLGITLCIECSGVHRSLGVHYSKVRSLTLDAWESENVKVMMELGNEVVNRIYEAQVSNMVDNVIIPATENCDITIREAWIKAKYVEKRFVCPMPGSQQYTLNSIFKETLPSTEAVLKSSSKIVPAKENMDKNIEELRDKDDDSMTLDRLATLPLGGTIRKWTVRKFRRRRYRVRKLCKQNAARKRTNQLTSEDGPNFGDSEVGTENTVPDEIDEVDDEENYEGTREKSDNEEEEDDEEEDEDESLDIPSTSLSLLGDDLLVIGDELDLQKYETPVIDGSDQESTDGEGDSSVVNELAFSKLNANLILYQAARAHNLPVMSMALALGADKNWRNEDDFNRTHLHQAVLSVTEIYLDSSK